MQDKDLALKIKQSYSPGERTTLDEIKSLDKKVKLPARIYAYTVGVVSALVLGTGMCLAMKVIGDLFALGVVIGCVGIAMCIANYYVYKAILKARRKKYGGKILQLSDEIINSDK